MITSCGGKDNDLYDSQDDIFKQLKKEHICTIIGLKILNEKFKGDQAKWKLVAMKSKKWLKKELNLENVGQINKYIEEYKINQYICD